MNLTFGARCAAGPAVALMLIASCTSQQALQRDVRLSRQAAYQRWERQRDERKRAEAGLTGALSLVDAAKLALLYNKPLQNTLRQRDAAEGRVLESYSVVLPSVSAVADYTRLDKAPGADSGGETMATGLANNYSAGLEVRQPVFRGGAIPAALRAARVYRHLADEQIRAQVQATLFEAAQAYYDTLLARHLYQVNKDAVESAQAHLDDVKQKRLQGMASDFDVLRAQVDVSNFRAAMIQQLNRIHLSKTRLLKAMGVSQDSEVTLADRLTYRPMKPVFEQAVRLAMNNRPDLYAAELGVRLQDEAVRIVQSEYWPQVDAVLTQQWGRPAPRVSNLDEWEDAWSAGVVARWRLFDGLAREGRLEQETAALHQRQIDLVDTEERVLLDVRQAVLSIQDAEELVESQRVNLNRAQEGLRLAGVGYREGVNTEVEVVDARAALTRARGLYYQALYSHTLGRLALQRAMGILGPRAGQDAASQTLQVRPAEIPEFEQVGHAPATQPVREPKGDGHAG